MGLRSLILAFSLMVLTSVGLGQISAWDYQKGNYISTVPKPFDQFGFEVGSRHILSSEVTGYIKQVDSASDRVISGVYGRSHDGRDMPYAIVSTPENLARLEKIVEQNRKNVFSPSAVTDSDLNSMPVIVWVGGGVHGNEASGVESCLLTLYHLAADSRKEMAQMLSNMVVIVAPNYNPDGRDRFAQWVNSRRGNIALPDNQDTEHSEPWPGGRTNKYWFDLNRDWFPLSQPESSSRHKLIMKFRPQVILDFHEQGGESYFFQPGVQSRVNRFTPKENQKITLDIGRYHAKALEALGETYFTEQRYDDFYIGKGSTYPDVIGSIGILFEQASSRSLLRSTSDGVLTFGNTIRNQVATSLSSLQASYEMRKKLLIYQRNFFREENKTQQGYYITLNEAGKELVNMLLQHEIYMYTSQDSIFVPLDQPLQRLLLAMFETQRDFDDNIFYDISSWSLGLVTEAEVTKGGHPAAVGEVIKTPLPIFLGNKLDAPEKTIGYLVKKDSLGFHSAVAYLLSKKLKGFYITQPIGQGRPGDLYFSASKNDQVLFNDVIKRFGVSVMPFIGETGEIVSWGGNAVTRIAEPKIALLVGSGVDSNNAGEQWWMLDKKLEIPVALIDVDRATTLDLGRYTTILVTGGSYPAALADSLNTYVRNGGTLVGTASGARWVAGTAIWTLKSSSLRQELTGLSYGEVAEKRGIDPVPGSIFSIDYDRSHPLTWGQVKTSAFREGGTFWDVPEESGVTVGRYSSNPVLSGFVSEGIEPLAQGKAAVLAKRLGSGRVVLIADNPCFRGYMTAQRKIWLNAILFSKAF